MIELSNQRTIDIVMYMYEYLHYYLLNKWHLKRTFNDNIEMFRKKGVTVNNVY